MSITPSIILALVWVILVSIVAMTPFPWHKRYALALLILFPVLLVMIAIDYGAIWSILFFAAGASMYRKPLGYYLRKLSKRDGDD